LSETPTSAEPRPPRARRPRWATAGLAIAGLLLAMFAIVRLGVLTPFGRHVIESELSGAKVGRFGRLHVAGLEGDVWSQFSVRRLTIEQRGKPWLDARDVRLRWTPLALTGRTVDLEAVTVGRLTLVRRPEVEPAAAGGGPSPVSLHVGEFAGRVEMLPAFSDRYGLYDVRAAFDLGRLGGFAGRASLASLMHPGDRADARFDLGRNKTIALELRGREAQGGALAGALGLPAGQPFYIAAHADGTTSRGRFEVQSRSGALTPIAAAGAWTTAGGAAGGRIDLAASRFLSGFRGMLGPSLGFQVTGAKAADGLYQTDIQLSSENVGFAARGEADPGHVRAGPRGLATAVAVREAKRVIGWPEMGAARFQGVLSGQLGDWKLAGAAQLEAPNGLGYRLANLHGPLAFAYRSNELTLATSADGVGGAGSGLLPALLGARPHASAELVFLNDGRILAKAISVAGPGLKITGQGQKGLLGGLAFSGDASFSNFAAAWRGGKGVMSARWSASQTSQGPWSVTYDAGAKDFATGFVDVDHLLGSSPQLKGQAAWDGRAWQIAGLSLVGAAGGLDATGALGGDGALQVKLAWRARGPIEVGPLEVAGAASGTGALAGTLGQPRADLAADFDRLDLPQLALGKSHVTLSFAKGPADTSGGFTLAGASQYGPAHAAASFRFLADGLDLSGLDAAAGGAHVAGQASLRKGAASAADLAVSLGPGAFLARGQASGRLIIADSAAGPRGEVKLSALDAETKSGGLILQKASLTGAGRLSALPYQVNATGFTPHGSWRAVGGGTIGATPGRYGATFEGQGRLRTADFKTLTPAVLRLGREGRSLSALAEVGGGRAQIEASQTSQGLRGKAMLQNVSLGLLDQDFIGRFDADVDLHGQGADLSGMLLAKLAGAGVRGAAGEPTLDGLVTAQLSAGQAILDAQLGNTAGLASKAHLVLPVAAAAAPFHLAVLRTAPMKGEFSADGEIKPLWDLLLGGDRELAGQAHAQATLSGTLADPQAQGEARVANGQFTDSASGLKLRGVTLNATLAQDAVEVSQLSGQDGAGGQIAGQGRISLERAGASSFRLNLQRFRLIDNDIATASASGGATISRAADGSVKLAGALTIDRADVAANPPIPSGVSSMDVVEVNREPGVGGGRLQAVNTRAPAVALDVTLKAARGVFLKGRGLNVELSMDAKVSGDTASPQLTGVAQVVRGDYDFAGKRFQFDNRSQVRLANDPETIRLDLTATRDDPSLTAVIRIEGTAAKPKVTLTSTPVLPNDEVLSQVLFGTSASQLSPLDAAELASALAELAGGSGVDVLGNLRSFAHLDRLAMGGGSATGVTVAGGKYITDNVYLELGGGTQGPTGEVDWRVTKSLSVVSKLTGAGGDSQVSVRWRKDY
jgi:translocation and assembly module TamB